MKKALVTGASRGIGYAITKVLLNDGISVTGTARTSSFSDDIRKHEQFTGIHVDLEKESDINESLKPLLFNNTPDILINNAGIFIDSPFDSDDKAWLEAWDKTLLVNLRSSSLLSKWFINAHQENGTEGILVNIASRAAYRGDTQEYAAYAASKAGMVAFTKSIARDYSKKGIYAYSIAPGFIDTDMARDSISVYGEEYLTRDSAFDTITKPDDVAEMVAFLCKGKVKHMSGSTFHINGGSYMI
jgi:NAD(P)-dependent dehydrogenase (short-subunit alcohol dehydrogenase family)